MPVEVPTNYAAAAASTPMNLMNGVAFSHGEAVRVLVTSKGGQR